MKRSSHVLQQIHGRTECRSLPCPPTFRKYFHAPHTNTNNATLESCFRGLLALTLPLRPPGLPNPCSLPPMHSCSICSNQCVHCHNLGSRSAQPEIESEINSATEGEPLSLLIDLIPTAQQNKLLTPEEESSTISGRGIHQIHTTSGKGIG